ncbi:hypothetical protein Nepgr_020333 [Nepenthes gracilis]|uniref:Uncharacterized protein n=1 Tax=Nepenthes gracilis TaxID=150966 RepID=A0AAD3XUZ6_NEPGR|nr:hypothetical protein Nepgr_020333 [Nepenthes gracilis]
MQGLLMILHDVVGGLALEPVDRCLWFYYDLQQFVKDCRARCTCCDRRSGRPLAGSLLKASYGCLCGNNFSRVREGLKLLCQGSPWNFGWLKLLMLVVLFIADPTRMSLGSWWLNCYVILLTFPGMVQSAY